MNDRITVADNNFDNLRTLLAATTLGEWEVDRNTPFSLDLVGIFAPEAGGYVIKVESDPFDEDVNRDEDAAFIVAAHNELPALLARLDEVTAEKDALAAVVVEADSACSACGGYGWVRIAIDDAVPCDEKLHDVLHAAPSSVLAAHDAKVRAEALRKAADLIENHWAPDSADGEEIATGSVDLLRARADEEENR